MTARLSCTRLECWTYPTGATPTRASDILAAWSCDCGAGESDYADLAEASHYAFRHLGEVEP